MLIWQHGQLVELHRPPPLPNVRIMNISLGVWEYMCECYETRTVTHANAHFWECLDFRGWGGERWMGWFWGRQDKWYTEGKSKSVFVLLLSLHHTDALHFLTQNILHHAVQKHYSQLPNPKLPFIPAMWLKHSCWDQNQLSYVSSEPTSWTLFS